MHLICEKKKNPAYLQIKTLLTRHWIAVTSQPSSGINQRGDSEKSQLREWGTSAQPLYKNSHGENWVLNVFQAIAREAIPAGKREARTVGPRWLVLSQAPLLGPSVGMPAPSAQMGWCPERWMELLSNTAKVQPNGSSPQGLIYSPTKSVRIFTWTFKEIWINPWEAGLKPDSKLLAFHFWHFTCFPLIKKAKLVGIPE